MEVNKCQFPKDKENGWSIWKKFIKNKVTKIKIGKMIRDIYFTL